MLDIQFFSDDKSLPLKAKTDLYIKITNGVQLLANCNEAKRVLSGIHKQSNILHFQERALTWRARPVKDFYRFAICCNSPVT